MRGGGGGIDLAGAGADPGLVGGGAAGPTAHMRSYRHELCFLPTTADTNNNAAAANALNKSGVADGAGGGNDNESTDSDGSTTDDGGGHDESQPKQPQQKPEAASAEKAHAAEPLELVGGENFLSVIRTASTGHGGGAAANNGDDYTLTVGPDPTVPSEGESGSCGGVILLVDVDGQYVAIKDIRDGGSGAAASAVQEAAGGAQIYLLRRMRRQLLAATAAAAAAAASAPVIPPRPSPTACAQLQPKEGDAVHPGDEKKKDGADIERGYDTDDENDDYLRQCGEQPSVARSKHSGAGGGTGGVGGLSNGSGVEYGPPEPLPRRQMRLLHRGDRLVLRLQGGHRTIRLEYHQKRRLEVDSVGTDDALMSTSVDAAAADSTNAAADGGGNGAKVAFAATAIATGAERVAGDRSPSSKLNGAPSPSRKAASPAKATGSPQKEPPATAHPHGPARGTIAFQDDDDTTTTDGAVRRLIGISVAGGKQSGASSDGASTNAAVVVEAKKTDHGDAQAIGGGTRGSGSKPAAPIPAVVAAPAGATTGAPKSARRSSAQSPEQQKHFSQSPQMEGDDDDEMEEYSYLTGEVIMKDQGYVSAITGDEETDMEQSAEIAHRKRSKIEAANRALGIDTANNAIGGVTETTKSAGGPQIDGKPRARETEEDAATASAVVLDAKAEKKVTIRGDSIGKAGAIQPPKAIEFPSQPSNEMPPPPSTVDVTDTAISPLPSTQRSAKMPEDEAGENVKVAAASSSPDEKIDPEVPESMDLEEDDNPKAGDEKFSDAHEEPMFLTAQEKDDGDDDDSDEETRDEDNEVTGGDTNDVEMEDAQGADAVVLNGDADSDGSDADDENEEGGALTQAYPMPTSPGTSHVDGVNTPESSPHRSHANADVDDDETTTAGPDHDDASHQSIDIYDQPTQPNPALHGFAEDSPEKFDLDTQPFNPREASPSPGRSSQNMGSTAAALATVNEETEAGKLPNKSENDGSGDSGGNGDDDDDDSATTAGSAPLLDEKKETAKVFTTNKTEDESIPTDAAVAALSVPTSVAGGDTPKPHASVPAQEVVGDDDIDSDATEDENAITTEAAVGAPSALSSLPTSDAGDKPSNDNDESDSETEDENEQQKSSGVAAGNITSPGAAAQPADLLTSIARLSQDKEEENDDSSEETTVCQMDVYEGDEGTDDQADKKIPDEALAEKARIAAEEDAEKRRLEQEGLIHREQERERLDKERLDANIQLLEKIKSIRETNREREEQEALAAAQEAEKKRLEEERAAEEARIAEEMRIEERAAAAKAEAEAAAAAEKKAEEERIAAKKKAEEEREAVQAKAAEEAKGPDTPQKEESQSLNKKRGRYSLRDSEDVEAEEEKEDQDEEDGIRVIITGITVSAKHKKMVESIGGELIEKVDDATTATHAIAGDGKTPLRRTPKLMICVCKIPNILNLDWLTKSSKAKEALDPKEFLLLNDTAAEKTYDFSMKETLKNGKAVRNQRGGLLGGWSVHFCKGVAGKKAPPEHELRLIVAAAGGTFLKTASARATKDVDASKMIIITSDPATAAQKADKDVKRLTSQGAKIFTTKWFFHSIITQHLSEIEDVPVGAEDDEDDDQKPAAMSSPKKGGRKRKAATSSSSSPKRESRRRKR